MNVNRRDFLISATAALAAVEMRGQAMGSEEQAFRILENEWIPMRDGTALAARLWLPEGAGKVPVVLEYLPYRKDDGTKQRDAPTGQYLAEHGIAFARVDIRGSGDSKGGLLLGEYMPHEQEDGVAAIEWLARQPWSNGSVGMRGKSWGGFNALQIAALAPPELKAIMPMCFADNRYTDDAHYIGGALGLVNFEWGQLFQTVLSGPPDPKLFGPGWQEEWLKRLRGVPPVLYEWLTHQRFDAFWQRASVGLDYSRIRCPVYCVGGWEDGYNNSITRALAELKVPRKALIGPWAHLFPPDGSPGPALEWAQEEVRWWAEWLRGESTGIMSEPMFRFYMPDCTASEVFPKETPGHWVAEDVWPSPRVTPATFYLNRATLDSAAGAQETLKCPTGKIVGLQRMEWIPFSMAGDLSKEQTPDDENSARFDSAPLPADIEIIGHPVVRLRIAANVPVAHTAVRLMEINADGKSWLATYALVNLTHRDSHREPSALVPGRFYDIEVPLNLTAHRFKKGNRLRVAVSESLWPLVWPAPTPAVLSLMTGSSTLTLPVRPPRQPEPSFEIPLKHIQDDNSKLGGSVTVTGPDAGGRVVIERQSPQLHLRLEMTAGQPNSCRWAGEMIDRYERDDWGVNEITARYELTSTTDNFRLRESVKATHDQSVIFERHWDHTIKRDLM